MFSQEEVGDSPSCLTGQSGQSGLTSSQKYPRTIEGNV